MNAPDPTRIAANATAMKVHLRVVPIGHTTYRVVTLRPSMGVRFASNYFHHTWHIVTGIAGAHVLGRLLWGLGFQRQPGTLVMIDAPHLVPTPFEADPSDPIVIVPAGVTRFDRDDLARLARTLRRAPVAPRTIRWHTFGMIAAFAREAELRPFRWRQHPIEVRARERVSRTAGFLCYTAPPALLRDNGQGVFRITGEQWGSYHPLAERGSDGSWHFDGEIQILPDFDESVAAAQVARREVIGDRAIASMEERQAVFEQRDEVEYRRRCAYQKRRPT